MRRDDSKPTDGNPARRTFLKTAGIAGVAAAAAPAMAPEPAEAVESAEEQVKARYRESPHVKRFYFLNRL